MSGTEFTYSIIVQHEGNTIGQGTIPADNAIEAVERYLSTYPQAAGIGKFRFYVRNLDSNINQDIIIEAI